MDDHIIEAQLFDAIRQFSTEEQRRVLDYVRDLQRGLPTADEIIARLESRRDELRALGVIRLGLFGSYSRGEATPDSDMDFIAEFDDLTLAKLGSLTELLESLFDCRIDLGLESSLRDIFREQIAREVRYVEGL